MSASRRESGVQRTIRGLFADAGVRGWLHVAELRRPAAYVAVDPDEAVPVGSVYKMPLMAAFCRLVDAGAVDPCLRVTLEPSDRMPGPTGISVLRDTVSMSLRDLVALMMTISDNTAADAVLHRVGTAAVDELCRDLGMEDTTVHGGVATTFAQLVTETGAGSLRDAMERISDNDTTVPPVVYDPLSKASATPADMALLLRAIWTGRAASAESCAFMRDVMGKQPWTHRLASGFPYDDVTVSGKTGTFGSMRHEAGVVELADGSAYTAVVFTQAARADSTLPRADAVIGAAARTAVEELRGNEGL
ncbi:serine hydrolase [Streptomyces sp. NPDC090052]|uniref:serine hydrolase n=1 Tax=unclassified Streptomyces TaxID=2593676 RepID=UPI00224EE961|nr:MULTISPECIES: serine hydrolase [unclassified Streptomyces]MCX4728939.1 class A beta-lactamase-related serine hydrolase [Streptomyces sp. NBC_01306]WSV08255.1 class A beta-lactamase-related serine hydrolase [Streptomyces sp. NBC_01020]WSX46344.1 class A beta-lactamase-related serine hydrolase [Streptomyces sp. NBC_00963]WSX65585.1 class A beta-lactamase-related serine hydrolase [Streptomyces sp. NBC_00932]